MKARALIFSVLALASASLAQQQTPIFPSNLAQSIPFNSRDELVARAAFDPDSNYPESVTFVGGISPKLFQGAEWAWRNIFGYAFFSNEILDRFFERPRLIVGRSSVPGLRYLCNEARFALYSVDRVPQQAMMVITRRIDLLSVKRELWMGGLLDGSGSSALLYQDEAFLNNLVIQLNLPEMISRATREC